MFLSLDIHKQATDVLTKSDSLKEKVHCKTHRHYARMSWVVVSVQLCSWLWSFLGGHIQVKIKKEPKCLYELTHFRSGIC